MRTVHVLTTFFRGRVFRWALGVLGLIAIVGGMTRAAGPPPAIPAVALASEPLYARGFRSKPSLTLALSVEFPTVGAAYRDIYEDTNEYVGYYDPNACYRYDAGNRYFVRMGIATAHKCGGTGFSGNFMNWSTSSAIDILRFALTGGDRVESLDTGSLTVLQRAVLPDYFYNSAQNFPSKQITSAQAQGAVPTLLLSGYTGPLYVANCLAQIYVGTRATGSCGAPGDNGKLLASQTLTDGSSSGLFSTSACSAENNLCTFPTSGTYTVAYGAGTKFVIKSFTGASASCTNGAFGKDPIIGTAKSCYLATTAASLSNDPYFSARVMVCDAADATARPDLCQRYPSGNFKPVGNLQKYSDRMRVAVFGYLMDQTTARNGGVLRSPMKYVGPNAYDNSFNLVPGANPLQEWDSSTGVFYVNPSPSPDTTMSVSGAINYTNHFGRTGASPPVYKTFDAVSELYYEALRYLQGLQPTPSAVSGITAAMKDGFPVYDTWPTDANPLVSGLSDYSCVKNNILTIGDVNTHGDRFIPGNTAVASSYGDVARPANAAANEPNFYDWTNVVGAFEKNVGVGYRDGKNRDQTTSNPMTVNSFFTGNLGDRTVSDQAGYYMAGMAYWANTHDIRAAGLSSYSKDEIAGDPTTYVKARPGMRVTSFFIDVNEGGSGSTLAGRKSNTFFLAAKYGGFSDDSTTGSPFRDATLAATDADWSNTTPGTDPKTYFLGSNGAGMIDALNNVFSSVAKQAGSIAGAAISGGRVSTSGGVYQAKFDPSKWSGDVVDYPITVDSTSGAVTIGDDTNPVWRASTTASTTGTLDSVTAASRNIYIGFSAPTAAKGTAVEFKWDATNFEDSTKTKLRTQPYSSSSTVDAESTGIARLAYLRGDDLNEGKGLFFRLRNGHKLGDIVNSAVVYSGAPSASITDSGYSTFYQTNAARAATVFVGANDGMLHAFDATSGVERFAYIPSFVIPKLAALTSVSYVHTSYVDATPGVGEALVGSDWKTVLVSGAGAGGQGVFALDVTNPSAFNAGKVLWEFSEADDPDLGNVMGRPQILKVRTSANGVAPATYKWYAVVASGVNNYANDGHASETGQPALFLLDLSKQAGVPWTNGDNYFKVSFPTGSITSANGILGFTAVDGANGEVSKIYAGDLQGNLWRLDFTDAKFSASSAAGNWDLATLTKFKNGAASQPLFVAKDASSSPKLQPITIEPAVVFGPNGSYIVLVGTGRFLEQADISTPYAQQSVYAVYDDGAAPLGSATESVRNSLQQATTSGTSVTTGNFTFGRPSTTAPTAKAGWYLDFPESASLGERMISGVTYFGLNALFGTIEPPANGCADGGGNQYVVNIANGIGTLNASPVGLQGQPIVIKVGVDAQSAVGVTGGATRTTKYQIFQQGSDGIKLSTTSVPLTTYTAFRRLSWRQLANP